MARIPDDEIKRLKDEISIVRLVEASGVELKKHGRDLAGRCPFHNDKTPSLVVSPSKNLWHCMGACAAGGSVIDWVMRKERVSFRQAVELLRGGAEVPMATTPRGKKIAKLEPVVNVTADDVKLLTDVAAYYHATLKQSPEGLGYLETRGLGRRDMVDAFKLGYANRTLGYHLPKRTLKAGVEIVNRLKSVGIIGDNGHEHFWGSIVVPIFDEAGNVVEMYGRKAAERVRGVPAHAYLPGPMRGVFNLEAFKLSKEIILCEAIFDALTFWCAGFRNVTAAYGVNGFTADHWRALSAHGTKRVLIAYDRDDAGDKAAAALAEELAAKGIGAYRIQFPRGMDANEYALKVTPAEKSLAVVVHAAVWVAGPARPSEEPETVETPPPASAKLSPLAAEAPPVPDTPVEVTSDDEAVVRLGDRRWRVRGMAKNLSHDQLRVNLLVSRGDAFHVDSLDLYAARARQSFAKEAAGEIGMTEDQVRSDLGRVLLKLEELHDARLRSVMEPKETGPRIPANERDEALAFLQQPDLLTRILDDFATCGVVGEEVNKLVGYLTATSRKLDGPLAVIIQSSSAAGKSSLMEAVLALMPAEELVKYSAMTGQSLFYVGETSLKHKILAIVEEAGAQRASYSLKLLQSEGELTIASTGKDPESGKLITHEYRVEGPVTLMLTTTAMEIDEELLNRAIVLTVDEDREQTRRIHVAQRKSQTLEGLLAKAETGKIRRKHQNAQRLLRPLHVVNPFAEELTFLDDRTRTRRDHMKYLALIRAVALLYQHQRPVKTVEHKGELIEYIEATREDIAVANRLAHATLGRSLDELAPQTRRLLLTLDAHVAAASAKLDIERKEYRFTRRELRMAVGWSNTQVRMHLEKLVDLEYVLVHRGGRGQQFIYELLYDGQGKDGKPFLVGLHDVDQYGLFDLKTEGTSLNLAGENAHLAEENGHLAGGLPPPGTPIAPPERVGSKPAAAAPHADLRVVEPKKAKNAHREAR